MKDEECCNTATDNKVDYTLVKPQNESDCGCACDCNTPNEDTSDGIVSSPKEFDITIDNKKVRVNYSSKNIVEIAKSVGISIPAPCFLNKKKDGCCMACVVEIDKKQKYACNTKPSKGMNIIVNRDDLKDLRKKRLLKYKEAMKNGKPQKCGGPVV